MATNTTNTTKGIFNQPSMSTYGGFQTALGSGLEAYASDPQKMTFFNQQANQNQRFNAGQTNASNQGMFSRMSSSNMGNGGAFMQSQLARNQRAGMARTGQGYSNLLLGAENTRMGAFGSMAGYKPLQTGGTETSTVGGLGAYLTPFVAGGLGMAASYANKRNNQNQNSGSINDGSQGPNWSPNQGPQQPMNEVAGGGAFDDTTGEPWGAGNPNFAMFGGPNGTPNSFLQ